MKFWAIEIRSGELLADEVAVTEAVSRIVGAQTVEALCLFTSRITLDAFIESFFPETKMSTRQELEASFRKELESIEEMAEGVHLRFPVFAARELIEVIRNVSLDMEFVALNPDATEQQVWSVKQFEAYLEDLERQATSAYP
jgi:DNA-binding PucR family transcriptional regulator